MNTHFKSALSKVTAEDSLVEKTEYFLRAALNDQQQGKNHFPVNRSGKSINKLSIAFVAAAFLLVVSVIGGYAYMKNPVAYISLDINPSVELGVNAFNYVVTVESINEDGKAILEGKNLINVDVEDALSELIDSAAEKNYIKEDGSTVISITAESKNKGKAKKLTDICKNAVDGSVNENEKTAIVYKDCGDLTLRKNAKELGISPGKLKLIRNIQVLDPLITVEELKDATVSEIIEKAEEIIEAIESKSDRSELSESQQNIMKRLKNVTENKGKNVKDAVKEKMDEDKERAKHAKDGIKDVLKQAKDIRKEAGTNARELRKQANDMLKNIDSLPEEEREEALEKAKELKKQANTKIKEAHMQIKELRENAKKQIKDAVKDAKKNKAAKKIIIGRKIKEAKSKHK